MISCGSQPAMGTLCFFDPSGSVKAVIALTSTHLLCDMLENVSRKSAPRSDFQQGV